MTKEIEITVLPGRIHAARQMAIIGAWAMAVIETDAPLSNDALDELRSFEPVISARQIEL